MVSEKTENYSVNKMVCLPSGVIFLPFLQMHPFFQGNFNKKTITSTYRFGIEFCTPYRFRITAHIRPIVSELRANTVTALFAQK